MELLKDLISTKDLLFDGAFGTYFASIAKEEFGNCELANISNKDLVREIHEEYIKAGANLIRTNTFAANLKNFENDKALVENIIKEGALLARKSIENTSDFDNVRVLADIGQIAITTKEEAYKEYKIIVDSFFDVGQKDFIFETINDLTGIIEIANYIKRRDKDAFVAVSLAVLEDGYTRTGSYYKDLYTTIKNCADIDAFGLNCILSASRMKNLFTELDFDACKDIIFALPNAGYPIVVNNRTVYTTDINYFATQTVALKEIGIRILGACCGSTPRHIKELDLLSKNKSFTKIDIRKNNINKIGKKFKNEFYEKLSSGKKVIAVELDPPKNYDTDKFFTGARAFKNIGIDLLTIADCPIGRARMDSSILATRVKKEIGLDTLPHMTCRDRNLNATKALILGTYASGISNILLVTGDPIPTEERDEVKSVYQFNSRKFASYIKSLNEEMFEEPIRIFAALNVNARNFNVELNRAKAKIEAGVDGFLTQPVMSKEAIENIKLAKKELNAKILGGLIPIVSYNNAVFMENEVNGIHVPKDIIDSYAGKDKQECEELAYQLTIDLANKIKDHVDGYYIITPFSRIELMQKICKKLISN